VGTPGRLRLLQLGGQLLGGARNFDLAVIKIPKSGLPAVKLGDTNQVKVGEPVIAIGNPLGLQQTVSAGVYSLRPFSCTGALRAELGAEGRRQVC